MTVQHVASTGVGTEVQKTSVWSRIWQQDAPGYLFLLPWFIGFFGLTLGPMISSLYLSFTHFDLLTTPRWARQLFSHVHQ